MGRDVYIYAATAPVSKFWTAVYPFLAAPSHSPHSTKAHAIGLVWKYTSLIAKYFRSFDLETFLPFKKVFFFKL